MAGEFHLAQINAGRLIYPLDDPRAAGFADNLDRINAIADAADGYIWRLVGEGGDATDLRPFEDSTLLINMSVWRDVQSLAAFVYRSDHAQFMRQRREWFEPAAVFMTLWWVPTGHIPTPAEGETHLEFLRCQGPTATAFTFKASFAPPGTLYAVTPILEECT